MIKIHGILTYAQFAEAFVFSGLVDASEVDLAFDGIVDKKELLDSVRIKKVIL